VPTVARFMNTTQLRAHALMCTIFIALLLQAEPSQGGLIILSDGNIYGLEQNGIIYKFNPNTHVYTLLQQTAGAYYYGGLMQAADGALYGVSFSGGANSQGYIFRFDLITHTYSNMYSFDVPHGGHPYYENLIQAADGKFYGTTNSGGANNLGVIFSYDISSNIYADIYDFDIANGNIPRSGLIQATNGKLYGMTYQGGSANYGVIFSYDISASQYSVLYNFDNTNGANPYGALTQASNGKLFGTTYNGGLNFGGVAFSYDIATGTYTKLTDFNTATGSHPQCDIQEATLDLFTGIASSNSSPASIYVDLAAQQLIIQKTALKDRVEVVMYDAIGKNVFQSEIHNQKSAFDVSSYQRGIYFVQLRSSEQTVTRKIILSK